MLHAKLLQSGLAFCHSMDCSPPVSSVHGILQARILEWVARSSSRGSPDDSSFGSSTASGFVTAEPPGKPKGMNAQLQCKCRQLHLLASHLDGKLQTTTADHPH